MPRDYVKSRTRRQERSGPSGVIWLLMGVLIGLIIAGVFYVKNQNRHAPQPMTVPEPQLQQKTTAVTPTQQPAKTAAKAPSTQNLQTQFDFYNILPSKKVIGPSGDENTTEIQNQNAASAAAAASTQAQSNPQTTAAPPATPTVVSEPELKSEPVSKPESEQPKIVEHKTKTQPSKQLPPVIQATPAYKAKSTVTSPPASSAKSSAYIVQVAALSDESDADQLKAQLTLLGFNVNVTGIKKNEKTFHRVWLGPFHSKSEAESAHKQLQENMISSQVLKSGS